MVKCSKHGVLYAVTIEFPIGLSIGHISQHRKDFGLVSTLHGKTIRVMVGQS